MRTVVLSVAALCAMAFLGLATYAGGDITERAPNDGYGVSALMTSGS